MNLHEIYTRRTELKKELNSPHFKGVIEGSPLKPIADAYRAELEALNKKLAETKEKSLKEIGFSDAKKELQKQIDSYEEAHAIDEPAIEKVLGEKYKTYDELYSNQDKLRALETSMIQTAKQDPRSPISKGSNIELFAKAKTDIAQKLEKESLENPALLTAYNLVRYRRGLYSPGHIAPVPSVEKTLDAIEDKMISGKPMFLHGPTGTGKTSLAKKAAFELHTKNPEIVYCNPQSRESNIMGKIGTRAKDFGTETFYDYGPLAKAMQTGNGCILDEFTALPKDQMSMLKGIMNAKPGDVVSVTGNGNVKVEKGFQMIFTANLKSEKNPERSDLPPEMANEFDQNNIEITYQSPAESYDIVRARLMNADGSADMSDYDMKTTVPKLLEAMEKIQQAYNGTIDSEFLVTIKATDPTSTKIQTLKKLVMNHRSIENMLDIWKTHQLRGNGQSFAEFIDDRLLTSLNFREYPEADRKLATQILASKGFLQTIPDEQLGTLAQYVTDQSFHRANKKKIEENIQKSKQVKHMNLLELAEYDPFNTRGKKMSDVAEAFVTEEQKEELKKQVASVETMDMTQFEQEADAILKASYTGSWGLAANKLPKQFKGTFEDVIPYKKLSENVDSKNFGKYEHGKEVFDTSALENAKVEVKDFKNLVGQKRFKVFEEAQKYVETEKAKGRNLVMPGFDYWKYILENPSKAPQSIKDGNYYYMPNAAFCNTDGFWVVPCVRWDGSKFDRGGSWLDNDWLGDARVVFLELAP